jgi:hypothetical protein
VKLQDDLRRRLDKRLQEMVQLEWGCLHRFGQGMVAVGCVFVVHQRFDAPENPA